MTDKIVVVYTLPNCGPCAALKRYLTSKDIPFTEGSLDEVVALGYRTAPVTKIGDKYITGFDLNKIKELLG